MISETNTSATHEPESFVVKGQIHRMDKRPLVSAIVQAYDKDLRHEQLLGETTADTEGRYEISYTRAQFRRAEKKRADLIVRVFDPKSGELLLGESAIIFNVRQLETVDLTVSEDFSEYERYLAIIEPVRDGVPVAELTAEDIVFLARETDIPAQHVEFLVAAARLAKQTAVPAAVFYGFARQGLPTVLPELSAQESKVLRDALQVALDHRLIPRDLRKNLDHILERLQHVKDVNPGVQLKKETATLRRLGEAVNLAVSKMETVLKKASRPASLDDSVLASLVEAGELKEQEAKALGLMVSLHSLLDGNVQLAVAVKEGTFPQIRQGTVERIEDLVAFDKDDWRALVEKTGATPPEGLSREDYAAVLARKIEHLYPSKTFLTRLLRQKTRNLSAEIARLQPLFKKNESVFGVDRFERLDVAGIVPDEVTRLRATHTQLRRFANTYPGLRLNELLDDRQLSPADKAGRIAERVTLLSKFQAQNANVEFLALDYTPDSSDVAALNFAGLSPHEQRLVLSALKTYQRIYAITKDAGDAQRLIESGYHSAIGIMRDGVSRFVMMTGLAADVASVYWQDARATVIATGAAVGTVADEISGGFGWLAVDNGDPDIRDYLKKIEGFAALFGSLDYCQCRHCQSILSPAAYFVDLMSFVETNILDQFADNEDHPLHLRVRRPDLWTLELTCKNTEERVASLEIINEILENYIAQRLEPAIVLPPPGEPNRATIENLVYERLLESVASFHQPFSFPLEKLSLYLAHFDLTRGDIATLLVAPPEVIAAAALNLSQRAEPDQRRAYELITAADTDLAFLRELYGLPFVRSGAYIRYRIDDDPTSENDVQPLLRSMGLTRAELGELSATQFISATASAPVRIQSDKRSADSIQNDIERIRNLTVGSLDRMHRFTRLWRQTPWSIKELDVIISHLEEAGLASGIGEATVDGLAQLLTLQRRFGLAADELCALWSTLPTSPIAQGKDSLCDRLFNLPEFVRLDGTFPKRDETFLHPSFRDTVPPEADYALPRLLAGLRVSDETLYLLITHLSEPLGLNLDSTNLAHKAFRLTLENLSLLYRHARLAEWLKLSVPKLFQLMGLAQVSSTNHIAGLNNLLALLRFSDWWQSTKYSLDDLGFITRGLVLDPSIYPDAAAITEQLLAKITAERTLTFADTIFAFLEGVTESQSHAIIKANPELMVSAPLANTYWLAEGFAEASVEIPEDIPLTVGDAKALLLTYHASRIIPTYLARELGISAEKVSELIQLAGIDLGDPVFTAALQGSTGADRLRSLIETALPLCIVFRDAAFDTDALRFMSSNPSLFDIHDFSAMTMHNIELLSTYGSFLTTLEEDGNRRQKLHDVLLAFDPAHKKFYTDSTTRERRVHLQSALAEMLDAEAGVAVTVHDEIALPAVALEALAKLRRCVAVAKRLGIGGDALQLLIANDYAKLTRASNAVLSAFRAKYPIEAEWREKVEPFEDKIRSRKRDTLTDYLLHSLDLAIFKNTNDLYHYFLIDVELEGCARTSRVVAAISSVQLYVHRVLMNLEQDEAGRVHPTLPQEAAEEWAWRKHYRVWEANRKVFLYPENYLEPDLRDDKTPLFEELQSTLLQQEINEETVLEAYASYMRGFDEVAKLKIAGSYHDIGEDTDVLHLFGVTVGAPPTHYYRTVENAYHSELQDSKKGIVWNSWRKIDVQIPVRKVSPLVYAGRLHVFWVEIVTTPQNEVVDGSSEFWGYQHKISLKFTTLRPDGSWSAPQKISLYEQAPFTEGDGIVRDPVSTWIIPHREPQDGYTLSGFRWEQVYPNRTEGSLIITGRDFQMRSQVDFSYLAIGPQESADAGEIFGVPGEFQRFPSSNVLCSRYEADYLTRNLYYGELWDYGLGANTVWLDPYAHASVILEDRRIRTYESPFYPSSRWNDEFVAALRYGLYRIKVAQLNPADELAVINGSLSDGLIECNGDVLYLQFAPAPGEHVSLIRRIGTTLAEDIGRRLFTNGIRGLLSTETQEELTEAELPIRVEEHVKNVSKPDQLEMKGPDFKGALGVYYREIFFHIPFLIASHLNSQGRFAEAQQWYHYIFDPTAGDGYWRYKEFRDHKIATLRNQLQDAGAIETYKKDPFNPHAIARHRLSAYQKAVVMKYIDNLLDWGDSLFAQDTMESINEATLLYVLAADILGERPAELGDCGEGEVLPKTYEKIGSALGAGEEFLVEMFHAVRKERRGSATITYRFAMAPALLVLAATKAKKHAAMGYGRVIGNTPIAGATRAAMASWSTEEKAIFRGADWTEESVHAENSRNLPSFLGSLIRQIGSVFCLPANEELRSYWDRVEDRLYKIRNCMNISGVRRELSLFAPEISPLLLVRAQAAGLSVEEVLNAISGNLPPYRFTYLIDRAKAHTAMVQGFGAALLSALEKKDIEKLNLLRTVHQQNILRMTSWVRENEYSAALETIQSLAERQKAIEYRRGYYQGLLQEGLSDQEETQLDARKTAQFFEVLGEVMHLVGALGYFIPQLGSPFALTYGGVQLGSGGEAFAQLLRSSAAIANSVAASAGLEASFRRREEGWQHQVDLANRELAELEKQKRIAEIRRDIAEELKEIHGETLTQQEEVYELYRDKFTNLGLYTWFSTTLQRLYREAYNSAYTMARLAEQAYRFERGDETGEFIGSGHWEASKAGLLAGERLLIDLQNLERRFLETNYRSLEIDQSFSLTQVAPAALLQLKETGSCQFDLPEIFFNLFYPGHYRRKIKAVRLTIPCITGPYTNVSATLRLMSSWLRTEPTLEAELREVPRSRSVSIATSTAQNDTGVFELNFRDERYMPFEGAGAISTWQLSLPKNFRQFDYQTINDVILHINYTAEEDGGLRDTVEEQIGRLDGSIRHFLTNNSLPRVFSLRQEFSNEFGRLLHNPVRHPVQIKISDKHFPFFLKGKNLRLARAVLMLRTAPEQSVDGVALAINGSPLQAFERDVSGGGDWAGLPYKVLESSIFPGGILAEHTLNVETAGLLAPESPAPADVSALDSEKLTDIYLFVEYGLT